MANIAAPPSARICVGSTAGSQAGPNSHGTTTGARTTSSVSSGKTTTVSSRTIRCRSASSSLAPAVRASTGNAICAIATLILRWYSTAS